MKASRKFRNSTAALISITSCAVLLSGFSRARSMQDFCTSSFIPSHAKLQLAMSQFGSGRTPASGMGGVSILSFEERKGWQDFAEARLKEMQAAMDFADADPATAHLKDRFSKIADDWVAFHGYAQRGKVDRMISSLNRIQEKSESIKGESCR